MKPKAMQNPPQIRTRIVPALGATTSNTKATDDAATINQSVRKFWKVIGLPACCKRTSTLLTTFVGRRRPKKSPKFRTAGETILLTTEPCKCWGREDSD